MTTVADIINRGLQPLGTRTNVTAAELLANTSNEAIQANLSVDTIRQDLLRMAPWNCGMTMAQLVYITSIPGTPENTSPATNQWERGQPAPPWAYEYQYPADCLRPCWIVPQTLTGQQSGVPIFPVVTGGAPTFWQGPPVKFKVATDTFVPVISGIVATAGTGYVAGDLLYFAHETSSDGAPLGAPPVLRVLTVGGSGDILTVEVVTQINGQNDPAWGGSYFARQHISTPIAVSEVRRYGAVPAAPTGAEFRFSFDQLQPQRVILTNQEYALLSYVKDVTNPNVMDTLFQSAWSALIGSTLAMSLVGDKDLAKLLIVQANNAIVEARKADGNEGLTINDVTPDFIRVRGIDYPDWAAVPGYGFDWGPLWPSW